MNTVLIFIGNSILIFRHAGSGTCISDVTSVITLLVRFVINCDLDNFFQMHS